MDGCNSDRKVEHLDGLMKNADPDLHEYLEKYWSVDDFKSSPFWEHAWLRHGTCMTNLGSECRGNVGDEYSDVLSYFRIAKALHEQFDVMQVLKDNGVPPGTSLPLSKLQRILEDAFSAKVNIHCSNSVLDSVQLWFKTRGGVQFEPVDPVGSSSCKANMITFPLKHGMKSDSRDKQVKEGAVDSDVFGSAPASSPLAAWLTGAAGLVGLCAAMLH
ncbi:hypothetical protein H4R35_002691 [Dimargaris xerosporica]|nr:hypothetical protein H4R35_002691 [Dimargaris xerosporica]